MSRFRVMFLTTGLLVLTATVALNGWAQDPGGGRGGPGGGRGGPGGFGGFGGPGGGRGGPGGGDSLLALATKSVVQEELKASDKQKTQISELNEDFNDRQRKLFEGMRQNGNGNGGGNNRRGGNRNNNNGNGNNGGGGVTGNLGTGGGNAFSTAYDLNPYALNVAQEPEQQPQENQQDDRQARFQGMRDAMTQLEQMANATLAKILNGKQYQRLNQIQIQAQGINSLVRPDVAEKIKLDEIQVESIQAVINDRRTAQRDVFRKQGEMFRSFRNQNGGGGGAGNGNNLGGAAVKGNDQAKTDATAKPGDGNGNGGGAGNGNGNGNGGGAGGNRRRGGPGGGGPGGFDREAMKKFMEQPEVKAQVDQAQAATAKLDNQATVAAYKILTKYQLASYKKLQGPPFDVAKLRPNFGGPGGGNRDANAAPAAKADTAKETAKADTAKETASTSATAEPKKSTTAKAKAKAKATSKTRRARQSQDFSGEDGSGDFTPNFDQN